jgi:hypothetical protein
MRALIYVLAADVLSLGLAIPISLLVRDLQVRVVLLLLAAGVALLAAISTAWEED